MTTGEETDDDSDVLGLDIEGQLAVLVDGDCIKEEDREGLEIDAVTAHSSRVTRNRASPALSARCL